MREELDNQLCEKYPKIFANRHGDMCETLMCWGFECGDGWYDILNILCSNIQEHIDWISKQHDMLIKKNPHDVKIPDEIPQVLAIQVKEKFGTLRFYYSGGDDYISGLVSMAESMSCVTCEKCGNRGQTRGPGWIRTLCDVHEDEYQEQRSQR